MLAPIIREKTIPQAVNLDWLPETQRKMVDHVMSIPMPRGRGKLVYKNRPGNLENDRVDNKKHIVFVCYYPGVNTIKKSILLRRTGRYYTTIISACIREDYEILRFFDEAYEIDDYAELSEILHCCSPQSLHAVSQPWIFGALAISASKVTGTRVVIEVNDSTLFLGDDSASDECTMERVMLENADAFTHKMPHKAIDELRSEWKTDTPDMLVHSYPLKEFFRDCSRPDESPGYKLVFAGGVIPYHIAISRGYECHVFDPFIEGLCSQSFELALYVNQNAREMFWEEHSRYVDFTSKFPGFSFKKGVPVYKLAAKLSEFNFGIYYENRKLSSYNPKHFKYNMATKIFSYIESGLPVLIPEHADYMKSFLEEYNVGVVYSTERLENLASIVEKTDHERMTQNISEMRRYYEMELSLAELEKAYTCQ